MHFSSFAAASIIVLGTSVVASAGSPAAMLQELTGRSGSVGISLPDCRPLSGSADIAMGSQSTSDGATSVALPVVPEPAGAGMMASAALVGLLRRRR